MDPLLTFEKSIPHCRRCPRLVNYLAEIKRTYPAYWCRPVPGFGDSGAKILVVGLAPGRFGSNRTGRMFTGDASGDFMYPVLYESGLATKPKAVSADDGLELMNLYISAAIRCAPPGNKPDPSELANCRPYLEEELKLLSKLKVVIAFGKIAHDQYVRIRLKQEGGRLNDYPFAHGNVHRFKTKPIHLIDTYHPSRQNTNTGKLTHDMFLAVFKKALKLTSSI